MTMRIETGLFPHMVLQRDGKVAQKATVTGTCEEKGNVYAHVLADGTELCGWKKRKVGTSDGKRFEATMAGLPVGGPYDVELACGGESVLAEDVLVGDVWILAGQSNMQGYGHIPAKPLGRDPMVRAFYMDDHWDVAADPIHRVALANAPVHALIEKYPILQVPAWGGVGPGVSFGQAMHDRTDVPQGLIASAHGGSKIGQWDPKLKKHGGRSLYGATLHRLAVNYPGGVVAGLLWYQGCSDARDSEAWKKYGISTRRLFQAFRKDLRAPRLPIVLVQIANLISNVDDAYQRRWSAIREDERLLGETLPDAATVPALDLELDESIHLSGPAQYKLGRRMAEAMESIRLTGHRNAPKRPIALDSVEVRPYQDGRAEIVVTFGNVVGKLVAGDRPTGFALEVASLKEFGAIVHVRLDGNRAILLTTATPLDIRIDRSALWYGFGCNPYCNIHDEAGRPLPAFGPYSLGAPCPTTSAFATPSNVRASVFYPAEKDLSDCVKCPDLPALKWTPPETLANDWPQLCVRHILIGKHAGKNEVVYFSMKFHCDGDWELNLLFGYDGPVRLWLDGKEAFYDPNGTFPAVRDFVAIPARVKTGDHDLVLALGTHGGLARGFYLRLERLAIPKREIEGGKSPDLPCFLERERTITDDNRQ